eukprot:TRINITY_DN50431_c0_g1_i2.p1 TRINITY_DN50431_c0_g1~~TRINITY_DN50431_c0_g1_i2.p1  ORF type:complete len:375 (-),score=40.78 TRINITY_DN50431_c0_g1_i2:30-1154(-)
MTNGDAGGQPAASKTTDHTCRLCNEGGGALFPPCACHVTTPESGFVHAACLEQHRIVQRLLGDRDVAARCGICDHSYPGNVRLPSRSLGCALHDFLELFVDTLDKLESAVQLSPVWLGSALSALFVLVFLYGFIVAGCIGTLIVFATTLHLTYACCTLEVIALKPDCWFSPVVVHLRPRRKPVSGLCKGMLLVAIKAEHALRKKVLYIIEHNDGGSVAIILNEPRLEGCPSGCLTEQQEAELLQGGFQVRWRSGGPFQHSSQSEYCMHNLADAPDCTRLIRGRPVCLSRTMDFMPWFHALKWTAQAAYLVRVLFFHGVVRWDRHELDAEVRQHLWACIQPKHVRLADLLELDADELSHAWERLSRSSHLQIFQE